MKILAKDSFELANTEDLTEEAKSALPEELKKKEGLQKLSAVTTGEGESAQTSYVKADTDLTVSEGKANILGNISIDGINVMLAGLY